MAGRPISLAFQRLKVAAWISVLVLLLLYPADWAVWRVLMLFGRGMGTAAVMQTTAATLKGNHFEVYSSQSLTVSCSRSLLPEAGGGPCWWLHLHPEQVVQY